MNDKLADCFCGVFLSKGTFHYEHRERRGCVCLKGSSFSWSTGWEGAEMESHEDRQWVHHEWPFMWWETYYFIIVMRDCHWVLVIVSEISAVDDGGKRVTR